MKKTEATNTGKSVKNDHGFIIKRFGSVTVYVRATGDRSTVWVTKLNPTTVCPKREETWSVYHLPAADCGRDVKATATGFKTHGDAEAWANHNII